MFDRIADFRALCEAADRAARGKRSKPGVGAFLASLERHVLRIERELRAGTWTPGPYTVIDVRDPKPRQVSAAPFRDRVVHHAVCSVVEPLFERGFIADSYANRVGKGTHRAVRRYEQFRDAHRHVLRADVFRFFPAIDHAILKQRLRRRIRCDRTLWLLDAIIDGSNPQEPVHRYYPGDDLFTPWADRRLPGASFAVAVGTTNPRGCARPNATGTSPRNATTTWVSESPARPTPEPRCSWTPRVRDGASNAGQRECRARRPSRPREGRRSPGWFVGPWIS